jgi:hypothetical protein
VDATHGACRRRRIDGAAAACASAGDLLGAERDASEVERAQVEVLRRLVDVDAHGVTVGIQVDHNAIADFQGVDAGALGKVDVPAVCSSLRTGDSTTRMHISRVR